MYPRSPVKFIPATKSIHTLLKRKEAEEFSQMCKDKNTNMSKVIYGLIKSWMRKQND